MKKSPQARHRDNKRHFVLIERRFIVAKPASGGYSWTLAAVLGEALLHAEEMFGERDKSYTLLGIDFAADGGKTWSPGNCKHIIVHLDMNCLTDRHDAYHTLAHEVIHLLSPTGKADANFLEEGLAVYFSQWYMNDIFGDGWWNNEINAPDYAEALKCAKQLLEIDSDVIKKLRAEQPTIAYITAEQLIKYCPALSDEVAITLARRFRIDSRDAESRQNAPTGVGVT